MDAPVYRHGRQRRHLFSGSVCMADFFISYNDHDVNWAQWITWTLEAAGYKCVIAVWDFLAGGDWVVEMHKAATRCERVIAVLSRNYLASVFTQREWASAFGRDPSGDGRILVPIMVESCVLTGLLRTVVYRSLVGLDEKAAREALLDAVKPRPRPTTAPPFPVTAEMAAASGAFAAPDEPILKRMLDILETNRVTFGAQCQVRDALVSTIEKRLGLSEREEYETFFAKHHAGMQLDELQLHRTIRNYTQQVLSANNAEILECLDSNGRLTHNLPILGELRRHLQIWMSKYNGVFLPTESMCLVYVGVHEHVPFPIGVEDAIRQYLDRPLLEVPPGPTAAGDSTDSNLINWVRSCRPHNWVVGHKGYWNHDDFNGLVGELRTSEFWPMDIRLVGKVVEHLKNSYLEYRDTICRPDITERVLESLRLDGFRGTDQPARRV
jgi:hypothetical protein